MVRKLILLFSCIIYCATPVTLTAMGGMPVGKGGMLPMPTEAEMKEIEQFLSTLSEEELNELAKLGEEIIATAEKEGIPLFDPTPTQSEMAKPASQPVEKVTPASQPAPVQKVEKTTNSVKVKKARTMLTDLIKTIDDIRQKVTTNQEFDDEFSPLNQPLNSCIYYLHVINDDRMTGYLIEDEFNNLYKLLETLEQELKNLNDKFDVPFISSTRTESSTQKQHTGAIKMLQTIIKRLEQAFFKEQLNEELEKILKKHEPEALKLKKELEAKEQFAISSAKKGAPAAKQPPAQQHQFAGPRQPIPMPAQPQKPGLSPVLGKNQQSGNTAEKKTESTKSNPITTEKKDTSKSKPSPKATISDLEMGIEQKLGEVENILISQAEPLRNFLADYANNKTEPEFVQNTFNEINFKLKQLKKTTAKWYELIEKDATSAADIKAKTKTIRDAFGTMKYQKTRNLHQQVKDVTAQKVTLEGKVKEFKELMDTTEKKLTDL